MAPRPVQLWVHQPAIEPKLLAACRGEGLKMAFQPIFNLNDGSVHGYEALMRPPAPWQGPLQLIEAARAAGLGVTLDLACCELAVRDFMRLNLAGRLFLNLGTDSMIAAGSAQSPLVDLAVRHRLPTSRIVVELTERDPIPDDGQVIEAMTRLRGCGLGTALDDYGQGYSGMRLWLELRPEIIKIDSYFISNLQTSSAKFDALRSMVSLAQSLETQLLAEGIETMGELAIIRDLGIALGQGYFLGRPSLDPPHGIAAEALSALKSRQIAVYPEKSHIQTPSQTVAQLLTVVAQVDPATSNEAIAARFDAEPQIQALAVVDKGIPIGLINRQRFIDRLNKPFYREIYGRRPCTSFMSSRPLIVEGESPIEALMHVLSNEDQRYLADGFIIVSKGRYLGMGTGEALVRAVSTLRIEAARHANPLTFLPGNIPITEHIARLLAKGAEFVAAYADMDNFKPYNDQYGYWRGDKMIKLLSQTLAEHVDPMFDFIGHVGGDDFVVLFQSQDWLLRCQRIVNAFGAQARDMYNAEDQARGGLVAEDRQGNPAFFPLTTLSIGVVAVRCGSHRSAEEVASSAAAAKREAKRKGNCVVPLKLDTAGTFQGARSASLTPPSPVTEPA